jgi:hypothetical protein
MTGLSYVGKAPTNGNEITNRLATNAILTSGSPSQGSVQTQLDALTTGANPTYAPKTYVDTQDSLYQLPSYYQGQDLLNVPTSSVGQPNGVAALTSAGKVPIAQMPVLGAGYILGPYGPTATFSGVTDATPLKIADWNIGLRSLAFQPLVFMNVFALGYMAHPKIEVFITNSTTAVNYASAGTLVALGEGNGLYNDYESILVMPVPSTVSQTPTNLPTTYNIWISAWIKDLNDQSVTISSGGVATGSAFILRGAQ